MTDAFLWRYRDTFSTEFQISAQIPAWRMQFTPDIIGRVDPKIEPFGKQLQDALGCGSMVQQKLFSNFLYCSRKSFRISSQLLTIKKLKINFIQRRRQSFLPAEIDPVQQGFLRFGDTVGVVSRALLLETPIQLF